MVGKRTIQNPREHIEEVGNDDLESGVKQRRFPLFKDAVNFTIAERAKHALKKQLQTGWERDAFEKFRKSDDEVS